MTTLQTIASQRLALAGSAEAVATPRPQWPSFDENALQSVGRASPSENWITNNLNQAPFLTKTLPRNGDKSITSRRIWCSGRRALSGRMASRLIMGTLETIV